MRILAAVTVPVFLLIIPAAQAERRTFTVASNADGYGIDRCLAAGAPCGAAVAAAYCRARAFEQVVSFRRLERGGDGAVTVSALACPSGRCDALVAIECSR
jgi:hypothetical protein